MCPRSGTIARHTDGTCCSATVTRSRVVSSIFTRCAPHVYSQIKFSYNFNLPSLTLCALTLQEVAVMTLHNLLTSRILAVFADYSCFSSCLASVKFSKHSFRFICPLCQTRLVLDLTLCIMCYLAGIDLVLSIIAVCQRNLFLILNDLIRGWVSTIHPFLVGPLEVNICEQSRACYVHAWEKPLVR